MLTGIISCNTGSTIAPPPKMTLMSYHFVKNFVNSLFLLKSFGKAKINTFLNTFGKNSEF